MKILCFLFVVSLSAFQPKMADPVDHTLFLLKQNSWAELYKTFAANVDVVVLDDNNVYPKAQAQSVVDAFFTKNQPFTVKLIHRVDSNPDYKFAVATISCKSGSYRTSFSIRNNNGTFQINELHIEMEKIK
jgi:hypothetical protein